MSFIETKLSKDTSKKKKKDGEARKEKLSVEETIADPSLRMNPTAEPLEKRLLSSQKIDEK